MNLISTIKRIFAYDNMRHWTHKLIFVPDEEEFSIANISISGQLEVQVLYLDKKLFGSHWPSFLLSSCTARKCTSTWAFLYLSFHAYSNTWSDLFRLTFLVTSVVRRIFKQKMSRIGPFLIKVYIGTFLCFGSLRIWLVTLDLTMISFLMTEQKQFNVH